jgi:hypothetical protein
MVPIIDHGTWRLESGDEGSHPAGTELLWNESWYFDFAAVDGSVGGYVRLGLYPNWGRAWYWACLVRPGQPLVIIADNQAPLPYARHDGARGASRGLVTSGDGYTATQETLLPLEAVRLTLDAAAAAVMSDPAAAYDAGVPRAGETTPFGFDLEWATDGGVYPYRDMSRYEIPASVRGTIRVGDEQISCSGHGERDHSWGERDWWTVSWLWTSGRLEDNTAFHGVQANLGIPFPWPSFLRTPDGTLSHRDGFRASTRFGADDFPAHSELVLDGLALTVTPQHFAPVALTSPDGRVAHFPRAMCRFETADGRTGYGWTEWNQPPGWQEQEWTGAQARNESGQHQPDEPGK